MKQYLLFCGTRFYPRGGWHDFRGSYGTLEAAKEQLEKFGEGEKMFYWGHIVDGLSGVLLCETNVAYAGTEVNGDL